MLYNKIRILKDRNLWDNTTETPLNYVSRN